MKPPPGHLANEEVACPSCGEKFWLNWDVAPPAAALLPRDRAEYGEAAHADGGACDVARLAVWRQAPDEVIPIEWLLRDGARTTRTWTPTGVTGAK